MADTFIETKFSWIKEVKDKTGKVISVSAKARYYKTDGPYTETDKFGFEHTYYNRHLIEVVEYKEKPGADICDLITSKIAAEAVTADLASDMVLFDNPILKAYKS